MKITVRAYPALAVALGVVGVVQCGRWTGWSASGLFLSLAINTQSSAIVYFAEAR